MPSHVADTEETRCLAFTKDHRRCRLQREDESKTCPYHKDYFSRWLETHKGFHSVHSSKREIEEYKFQITNNHVHIPESYVAELGRYYRGYYLFLLKHTGYFATVNTRVLSYSVKSHSWSIFSSKNHRAAKEYYKELLPLFTDPTSIFVCFCILWEEMVEMYRFYKDDGQKFMSRFRHVFFSPAWRPILFNRDLWYVIQSIWEDVAKKEEFQAQHINPTLRFKEEWSRERFQDMLYEFTVHHQTKLKERIQPFKEELMAAAWHPNRVEKWLEAGGFELFDSF